MNKFQSSEDAKYDDTYYDTFKNTSTFALPPLVILLIGDILLLLTNVLYTPLSNNLLLGYFLHCINDI